MLRWVVTPYCAVALLEPWNAPPGRFFAAYSARGGFRALAGHATIDEFATLSSPIFLCPRRLLGKIYDVGLSLGHRRHPEMGLDLGWPPLCVGLDLPTPALPEQYETDLLTRIEAGWEGARPDPGATAPAPLSREIRVGSWVLERHAVAEAVVLSTDAPLLPLQLHRLCQTTRAEITIGVATGNRLVSSTGEQPLRVEVIPELQLRAFTRALEGESR